MNRPATEAEIRHAGAEPGYCSPVGLEGITDVLYTTVLSERG
jgi:hypothetical protein